MSAGTEPARWSQPRAGSQGGTVAWLEALSSGACTAEAFLSAMRDQFQGDCEGNWEVGAPAVERGGTKEGGAGAAPRTA